VKDCQLQVRVSAAQKNAIKRAAVRAGRDISSWILSRCLNEQRERFEELIKKLAGTSEPSYVLAEFNDFLAALPNRDFGEVLSGRLPARLDLELSNRVAAMVEYAAHKKNTTVREWPSSAPPLSQPVFDTELQSLRIHLLLYAPPPFKRRNIFLDASIGDRV
jgi:hypothetical protein